MFRLPSAALMAAVLVAPRGLYAQTDDPPVVISGGPDGTGRGYTWTVTNHADSPIVGVEIPHFRGGLFDVPAGWSADCTNLVGVGVADVPGICRATADVPEHAIPKPDSATFHLQLSAKGAKQGFADVRVRFADQSTAIVKRVMVPVQESLIEKFLPLIGLAFIGLLVVLVGGRKRAEKQVT